MEPYQIITIILCAIGLAVYGEIWFAPYVQNDGEHGLDPNGFAEGLEESHEAVGQLVDERV